MQTNADESSLKRTETGNFFLHTPAWLKVAVSLDSYCIVILDHGGTLNHMCLDRKPFRKYSENKRFASGKWLCAVI
jgi:hypothetical protein